MYEKKAIERPTDRPTEKKKQYCMISSRNQKTVNKIPLHFWSWEQIWNVKFCVFKTKTQTDMTEKKYEKRAWEGGQEKCITNRRKKKLKNVWVDARPSDFYDTCATTKVADKNELSVWWALSVFSDCFKHFDLSKTGVQTVDVHFCHCLITFVTFCDSYSVNAEHLSIN